MIDKGIRSCSISKDRKSIKIYIEPHHCISIKEDEDKNVTVNLFCTHHGIMMSANDTDSEFYRMVEVLRREFPQNRTD